MLNLKELAFQTKLAAAVLGHFDITLPIEANARNKEVEKAMEMPLSQFTSLELQEIFLPLTKEHPEADWEGIIDCREELLFGGIVTEVLN